MKDRRQAVMQFLKKKRKWTKRKAFAATGGVVLVAALVLLAVGKGTEETAVYKETTVKYGTLTVGVTESGSVNIGTVEQTFDLDMSALQRVETGSTGGGSASAQPGGMGAAGGMGGGMIDVFSQMMGGGANLVGAGDDSSLTVTGVLVSVGQQVEAGDALYLLDADSVTGLEEELQGNVNKAEADLEAVYADRELSQTTAEYTYESSLAYGKSAETEYQTTLQQLAAAVESSRVTLERAQTSLTEYQGRLEDITASYGDALQALENCRYSLDHTSPTDEYQYAYYYDLTESAQQTVDSLEKQKEELEKSVEQAEKNVETAEKNYHAAKRKQEQGLLSAGETRELRRLAYETAQETYDVTLAYLEEDVRTQEEIYQETKEKWEEYSSYISGNTVLAQYNGVITSVELAEDDIIRTGSALITLYDMEDVTMTVSLYEEDMTDISVGSPANISFTAYPEEIFTARVTEISDASTDSSGNVLYEVTVTLEGDVSGLFQGMTGDITFVSGQCEDTLYVLKRAVVTEGNKSYVRVRGENGRVSEKEVTTGFSDGTYVQITEGLKEGDIVLIESRVSRT